MLTDWVSNFDQKTISTFPQKSQIIPFRDEELHQYWNEGIVLMLPETTGSRFKTEAE